MDSFSVPKLCLGHPTKGYLVFLFLQTLKGCKDREDVRSLCRSD